MKRLFFSLLILFVAGQSNTAFAQTSKKIQGKVITFEESFPLEGVSVSVKGSKNATGTQPDGTFNLEIKPADSILVFSQEGYETQEIKISPLQTEYNIVLKSSGTIAVQRSVLVKLK
jgi:hypothetical protein